MAVGAYLTIATLGPLLAAALHPAGRAGSAYRERPQKCAQTRVLAFLNL